MEGSTFHPDPRRPGKPRRWDARSRPELPEVRTASERRSAALAEQAPRVRPTEGLGASLLYPLRDGPGVALLMFFPPFLWVMSVPIFDLIAILAPGGEFNALALVIVPFTLPLVGSFAMTVGYVLLWLGQVLVSGALAEFDHPRFPGWDSHRILEGLGRLIWAAIIGGVVGGLPAWLYGSMVGSSGLRDRVVLALLIAAGAAYAQMAVAASMLHDNLAGAHPVNVVRAIARIGGGYLVPCLVNGGLLALAVVGLWLVLFRSASLREAILGLWAWWVFALLAATIAARVLGLTYARYAEHLGWFRARPGWAGSGRTGRIYANS